MSKRVAPRPRRKAAARRPAKHEHTPGPWSVRNAPVHDPKFGHVFHDVKGGRMLATTCCPYTDSPRIAQANARLIAAAPDMLAALRRPIICEVEEEEREIKLVIDGIEISSVDFNSAAAGALLQFESAIRSAIAKAEGLSP
jgi:hypothetical protein